MNVATPVYSERSETHTRKVVSVGAWQSVTTIYHSPEASASRTGSPLGPHGLWGHRIPSGTCDEARTATPFDEPRAFILHTQEPSELMGVTTFRPPSAGGLVGAFLREMGWAGACGCVRSHAHARVRERREECGLPLWNPEPRAILVHIHTINFHQHPS